MKEQKSPETGRDEAIAAILAHNQANFDQWRANTTAFQTFAVPEAYADVFVPRRLLELADNPENMHAYLREAVPERLDVLVYERGNESLSTAEAFAAWQQYASAQTRTISIPMSQEGSLVGLDYKHAAFSLLIAQGVLTLNDKVYLEYVAKKVEGYPHVAITDNYKDRVELQRQGIGRSFYDRLEYILRQLGFTYLAGYVISSHPQFFEKDRKSYHQLDEQTKAELPSSFADVVRVGEIVHEYKVKKL